LSSRHACHTENFLGRLLTATKRGFLGGESDKHTLLDVNLLIALAWPQHVHHTAAHRWFDATGHKHWATCPLTQLGFIRISSNPKIIPEATSPREALEMLGRITALPGHVFWPDQITPLAAPIFNSTALVGHRQLTGAYLLALARHHHGKLATIDGGPEQLITDLKERSLLVTQIPVHAVHEPPPA
jgi:toxin-antitoxin system PIN domain toxin